MKIKYLLYGISITIVSSCTIINPDIKYKPKSSEEFIFPLHSDEFTKSVEECIKQKNFPCNYPEPQDSLSKFQNTWYSKHLISLKEPILYNQREKNLKVIRFTHLGTWSNPFSYKIENKNSEIIGIYSKSNGQGGYKAGKRIIYKEKKLSLKNWELITLKLDSINFQEIPTHDPNVILDGAEWILEILIKDEYDFVTRNSPDIYEENEYAELCKLIMEQFYDEK